MIVLDTNVISELIRPQPEPAVVSWVDDLPLDNVFITAITAAELLFGVARLPDGRRKQTLTTRVRELIDEDFEDRVLPFDRLAGAHYARICAEREQKGRPISMADAQIAAICCWSDTRLATRNVSDFVDTGVEVINPWETRTRRKSE